MSCCGFSLLVVTVSASIKLPPQSFFKCLVPPPRSAREVRDQALAAMLGRTASGADLGGSCTASNEILTSNRLSTSPKPWT